MKKNKLFLILLLLFCISLCPLLSACEAADKTPTEPPMYVPDSFVLINYTNLGHNIYQHIMYDPETMVMYSFFYGSEGCAVTVMYNTDGTPKIYTPYVESTD